MSLSLRGHAGALQPLGLVLTCSQPLGLFHPGNSSGFAGSAFSPCTPPGLSWACRCRSPQLPCLALANPSTCTAEPALLFMDVQPPEPEMGQTSVCKRVAAVAGGHFQRAGNHHAFPAPPDSQRSVLQDQNWPEKFTSQVIRNAGGFIGSKRSTRSLGCLV